MRSSACSFSQSKNICTTVLYVMLVSVSPSIDHCDNFYTLSKKSNQDITIMYEQKSRMKTDENFNIFDDLYVGILN